MKKKGEELIVIHKKTFFLIVLSIAIIGVLVGYTIGYITVPAKEVYVQKTIEPEKTVLPSTLESQLAKKQDNTVQQNQTESSEKELEKENVKIIKEVEAKEKNEVKENKELAKTSKVEKHSSKKLTYRKTMYAVQIGAFNEMENAKALIGKLKEAGINAQLVKENLYKIRTDYYRRFTDAQKISEILKSKGFENFIIKISKTSKGG